MAISYEWDANTVDVYPSEIKKLSA